MKKYSSALLAVPLAASMLLAGCGGDAKPDASSSSSPTSSPTTSSTPTSSPTAAGPKVDPNIPAAARANTGAGAEAFTKYFFAQLNVAWATPKAGLVAALSVPACKTCAAFEGTATELEAKRQHYRGDVFSVSSINLLGVGPRGHELLVVGRQEAGATVDQAGKVIETSAAQAGKFVISLRWTDGAWKAIELQVQK